MLANSSGRRSSPSSLCDSERPPPLLPVAGREPVEYGHSREPPLVSEALARQIALLCAGTDSVGRELQERGSLLEREHVVREYVRSLADLDSAHGNRTGPGHQPIGKELADQVLFLASGRASETVEGRGLGPGEPDEERRSNIGHSSRYHTISSVWKPSRDEHVSVGAFGLRRISSGRKRAAARSPARAGTRSPDRGDESRCRRRTTPLTAAASRRTSSRCSRARRASSARPPRGSARPFQASRCARRPMCPISSPSTPIPAT